MWLPDPREPSGAGRDFSHTAAKLSTPARARFGNACRGRQLRQARHLAWRLMRAVTGTHRVELEGLLECGLVGLPFWRDHLADEIGDSRMEDELRPVGILEPELVIVDDPGAM